MKIKRSLACLLAVLFLLPLIPVNRAYAEPFWSMDFKAFVLDQEYFQTGLSFNSDAYYQTRFTLYDFERDGEPELLVFNGGPSLAQMTVYVFKHTSQGINHVGNVGFRSCELFYYEDPSLPGVFCTEGNNGNFRTVYYELQNNSIISEDVTDSGITGGPIYLSFYTLDEIRTVGWGEFVLSTCGISGTNVDESVDETQWDESEGETNTNESESTLNTQQQFASNIFLSNFSEQGAFERRDFDLNNPFVDDLVFFAYLYCKINRHEMLGTAQVNDSYYYTLSLADANTVLNRHFALSLSEDEAASFPINTDPSSRYNSFYDAGTFYFPAADGESYNRLTVVENMFLSDDGRYMVYFDIYELDIQEYWRANGVDPSFYYLSASQAANDPRLTWKKAGVAIVTPYVNNGTDTYQLQYYRVEGNQDSLEEATIAGEERQIEYGGFSTEFGPVELAENACDGLTNHNLAVLCAMLSDAAYGAGGGEIIKLYRQMFGEDGWDSVFDYDEGVFCSSAALGKIRIENVDTNVLVVTFKGTQVDGTLNLSEVFADISTSTTDYWGYRAFNSIVKFENKFLKEINSFFEKHEEIDDAPLKVIVTGHSLGGAAANLFAAHMTKLAIEDEYWSGISSQKDIFCYTYGAIDSISIYDAVSFADTVRYPITTGFENIHNIYNIVDSFGPYMMHAFRAKQFSGYGKFGHIDLFKRNYHGDIFANHMMTSYLDAVASGFVGEQEYKFSRVWNRCPVDIEVYENDTLIGSVHNDVVDVQTDEIEIIAYEGEKMIVFPSDKNYSFRFLATDNGTMEYSVESFQNATIDIKTFSNVALTKGKIMLSDIAGSSLAENFRLYVLDSNETPVAEINPDGTETVVQENGTGSVMQDNSTNTPAKESDVVRLFTIIPRWIFMAAVAGLIALIVLAILMITRRKQPEVKRVKKASSHNSRENKRLPAFSDTHCCVCGRRLDGQYKVFFRTKDGREACLDKSCFRKINTLLKRENQDPEEIRTAQRYIRSRYDAVDPVVEEQLMRVVECDVK